MKTPGFLLFPIAPADANAPERSLPSPFDSRASFADAMESAASQKSQAQSRTPSSAKADQKSSSSQRAEDSDRNHRSSRGTPVRSPGAKVDGAQGSRRSSSRTSSPASSLSDTDLDPIEDATNPHPVSAEPTIAGSTDSSADVDGTNSSSSDSITSQEEETSASSLVAFPLIPSQTVMPPLALAVPLPEPSAGPAATFSGSDGEPGSSYIGPAAASSQQSSNQNSSLHPGPDVFVEPNFDSDGIDIRGLGLETVSISERDRLAQHLRQTLARLEDQGESDELVQAPDEAEVKIIPFPGLDAARDKVIPVQFRPDGAGGEARAGGELDKVRTEPQLPASGGQPEKTAQSEPLEGPANRMDLLPKATEKPGQSYPVSAESRREGSANVVRLGNSERGTSAARKDRNMDSHPSRMANPVEEITESSTLESSAESLGPHRPETRPYGPWVAEASQISPASLRTELTPAEAPARGVDTAGAVERIARLVGRETVLVRQSSSESMAVVLRPDANTELLLHLSQRNGQIEANVRCERGDYQQLNALWGQLQEALAHQKVRLAPLEEAAPDTALFRNAGGFSQPGRDESSRQSRSNQESMEEWPAPASPDQIPAHVRSRRESGHRLSTSRPGWETWA